MHAIFETEVAVAKDHTITVLLPPGVTADRVKVIVTAIEASEPSGSRFERPVGLSCGKVQMLPSFFEPMSEEDTGLWEGREAL